MSLGELEQICLDHSTTPNDVDVPFVPRHIIYIDDDNGENNFFRFLITTRRLFTLLKKKDSLHIDATYKVTIYFNPICFLIYF